VTGDDLFKPEDLAVPGKPVATVQRTLNPPTYVFQATGCGLDAEGAYCDVYESQQYWDYPIPGDFTSGEWAPNGTSVDINCEDGDDRGYDRPFSTDYVIRGVWSNWRYEYGACIAYGDTDYDGQETELQERNSMPVYSKGGHQFYNEVATRCEVGKGAYRIQRIRRGGDDFTTALPNRTPSLQSATSRTLCTGRSSRTPRARRVWVCWWRRSPWRPPCCCSKPLTSLK
jgi:hypothetical protein